MFLGTHHPKLDEKGRFFLPAKFREEFADGLVISRGQDHCLAIYREADFVAMASRISGSSTNRAVRNYQRMLAAGASAETPDKQGRLTINPALRKYAGLETDIVVVGAIDRVEVWDAATWEEYSAAQEEEFAEMNEEFAAGD